MSTPAETGPTVHDLARYGERGWRWTMQYPGLEPSQHRTNADGEGIYTWSWSDACWRQQLGHMQYQITASDSDEAARQIIAQWWRQHRSDISPLTPDSKVITRDYLVRYSTGERYEIAQLTTETDLGPIIRIDLGPRLGGEDPLYALQEYLTPTEDGQWWVHHPSGGRGAWGWIQADPIV